MKFNEEQDIILNKDLFKKDKALYGIWHIAKSWSESANESEEPHTYSVLEKDFEGAANAKEFLNKLNENEVNYLGTILQEEIDWCEESGEEFEKLLKAYKALESLL